MVAYSRQLYLSLLGELRARQMQPCAPQQRVEAAFGACYHYWSALAERLALHTFRSVEEEVFFFRHIKPRFISLLDYYQYRYHALLFLPDLSAGHIRTFWEREATRLPAFLHTHPAFADYYTGGRTDADRFYFTNIAPPGEEPCSRLDGLVSRLLALRRYDRYVQRRLREQ